MSILNDIQREQDIYELAVDIARQIFPIPNLLLKYKITEDELKELHENIIFKEIVKQATAEWNAAGNTHRRTKLKAAILTEQFLPTLYESMTNKGESLPDKVKGLDLLAKIAGLQSSDSASGPIGSTFKLSINFAGGTAAEEGITLEMGATESRANTGTPGVDNSELEQTESEQDSTVSPLESTPISNRFAGKPPEDI